ncbi:MAG: DnaB-like helicase N-terminal domain-containing protein, partial [Planctomycetota bacterium]
METEILPDVLNDKLHHAAAERELLSALLRYPANIADVTTIIAADDLFDDRYTRLFTVLVELFREGGTITLIAVNEEIKRRGWTDGLDANVVIELADESAHAGNIRYNAGIVKDYSLRRKLHSLFIEGIAKIRSSRESGPDLLAATEKEIAAVTTATASDAVPIATLLPQVIDELS